MCLNIRALIPQKLIYVEVVLVVLGVVLVVQEEVQAVPVRMVKASSS